MEYRKTCVDLILHSVSSFLLAWFFYRFTGGWLWSALVVLGGIFIDVDHFFDYFLYYGWKFSPKAFFGHEYLASGRVYIIFHSLELVVLMWIVSFFFLWIIPLVSGMTLHLLIDALFSHRATPFFLSFIFRWRNRFLVKKLCPRLDFSGS